MFDIELNRDCCRKEERLSSRLDECKCVYGERYRGDDGKGRRRKETKRGAKK
jgi:hypothetical protein